MESKIVQMNAVKPNVAHVQMAKFLFEQYVLIAKPVNKTAYSDCNAVQTEVHFGEGKIKFIVVIQMCVYKCAQ